MIGPLALFHDPGPGRRRSAIEATDLSASRSVGSRTSQKLAARPLAVPWASGRIDLGLVRSFNGIAHRSLEYARCTSGTPGPATLELQLDSGRRSVTFSGAAPPVSRCPPGQCCLRTESRHPENLPERTIPPPPPVLTTTGGVKWARVSPRCPLCRLSADDLVLPYYRLFRVALSRWCALPARRILAILLWITRLPDGKVATLVLGCPAPVKPTPATCTDRYAVTYRWALLAVGTSERSCEGRPCLFDPWLATG